MCPAARHRHPTFSTFVKESSRMSASTPQSAVTVLGLGPMGRALAGALLDAGLAVTVWNRTPGRDRELVARGAAGASSPESAVAASPLTVLCVVDYDAADAIVGREAVTSALKGRTLVNLTADTPARARETGAWAAAHGIGTPDAVFLHSGPEELYREHKPALDALGGTHTHLGADIGRAASYDLALLDIFWTAMAGYAHALALAKAEGVTARELAPFAQGIAAILPPLIETGAEEADTGSFSGDVNPITSAASSMKHIVQASEERGIDASVMRAAEGLARRVIGLGHGEDGFLRITDLLAPR
ncbi:NAD(P)-binding domain-containing protein [Nonomuraea sp. NPDC049421]|uniref:NAD(P)-dependent oxidoreductase n=1 Tax=Nonomuraea sp. NPDC049421 TaxID=3155275 RepID=UPI003437C942